MYIGHAERTLDIFVLFRDNEISAPRSDITRCHEKQTIVRAELIDRQALPSDYTRPTQMYLFYAKDPVR